MESTLSQIGNMMVLNLAWVLIFIYLTKLTFTRIVVQTSVIVINMTPIIISNLPHGGCFQAIPLVISGHNNGKCTKRSSNERNHIL